MLEETNQSHLRVEIVVPCDNEQDCIRPLYAEIKKVFDAISKDAAKTEEKIEK